MNPTNILTLADAIEARGQFDLTCYSGCFCGVSYKLWPKRGISELGMNDIAPLAIPSGWDNPNAYPGNATASQAAKVLRHLAETGTVDWAAGLAATPRTKAEEASDRWEGLEE